MPAIEEWSQNIPKRELNQHLLDCGFSMGIVQDAADLDSCPHLETRQHVRGQRGHLRAAPSARSTPQYSSRDASTHPANPPLQVGPTQSTTVLCSIGGLTPDELAQMEAEGKA